MAASRITCPATRIIRDDSGRNVRVPAHVAAPPRMRAGLSDWLASRREPQEMCK